MINHGRNENQTEMRKQDEDINWGTFRWDAKDETLLKTDWNEDAENGFMKRLSQLKCTGRKFIQVVIVTSSRYTYGIEDIFYKQHMLTRPRIVTDCLQWVTKIKTVHQRMQI